MKTRMAAFQVIHVSPAKHSYASVTDGRTDRRTDDGHSDPYVLLCFAGDTKTRITALQGKHDLCHLRKIVVCDYQKCVIIRQTDARQSNPMHVMRCYALKATQLQNMKAILSFSR